jgi:hypothetical protein
VKLVDKVARVVVESSADATAVRNRPNTKMRYVAFIIAVCFGVDLEFRSCGCSAKKLKCFCLVVRESFCLFLAHV